MRGLSEDTGELLRKSGLERRQTNRQTAFLRFGLTGFQAYNDTTPRKNIFIWFWKFLFFNMESIVEVLSYKDT